MAMMFMDVITSPYLCTFTSSIYLCKFTNVHGVNEHSKVYVCTRPMHMDDVKDARITTLMKKKLKEKVGKLVISSLRIDNQFIITTMAN